MFSELGVLTWQMIFGFLAVGLVTFAVGNKYEVVKEDSIIGKAAFYMRYSSHNQRGESIEDQRRNIVKHLDEHGIAHDGHNEFTDEAVSGTTSRRKGFQELLDQIRREEIKLVAIDDLSRLTRGKDLGILWDTMKAYNCRLISAIDNIDSDNEADELSAMFKGVINNIANKINGRRIRRGIEGRVLDGNASYGAHPYGYETVFTNPEAAAQYRGIGPKPMKTVQIKRDEADIVVEGFRLFGEQGRSQIEIAHLLNNRNIQLGRRSNRRGCDGAMYRTGWTKSRITKMLTQKKYIGDWRWGERVQVKTPEGKRIVRSAKPGSVTHSQRPDLRIVPQELWGKVQDRLNKMRDKYGVKPGQGNRGYKRSHCSEDYPFRLSTGLLFCGSCGSRLHLTGSKNTTGPYYKCPIAACQGKHKGETACSQRGSVHVDRAEQMLAEYLRATLTSTPKWLEAVYAATTVNFHKLVAANPDKKRLLEGELAEINRRLDNMANALAAGTGQAPQKILELIRQDESKKSAIEAELARMQKRDITIEKLPPLSWVKKQLADMTGILDQDAREAAMLMKRYFGKVMAHSIVAPGKKRGHMELRFRPNHHNLVDSVIATAMELHSDVGEDESLLGEEVCIVMSGNNKLDDLMPTIEAMREAGKTWRDIEKELKIQRSWANKYYRKRQEALKQIAEVTTIYSDSYDGVPTTETTPKDSA